MAIVVGAAEAAAKFPSHQSQLINLVLTVTGVDVNGLAKELLGLQQNATGSKAGFALLAHLLAFGPQKIGKIYRGVLDIKKQEVRCPPRTAPSSPPPLSQHTHPHTHTAHHPRLRHVVRLRGGKLHQVWWREGRMLPPPPASPPEYSDPTQLPPPPPPTDAAGATRIQ